MEGKKRSARDEAAGYLTHRMRTVAEIRRHLSEKGYEAAEIDETVEELLSLKYLDDYQYALAYCEYAYEKKRGSLRIKRELADRGVDLEVAENAIADFAYEKGADETEAAFNIAMRDISDRNVTEIDDKVRARIARRLENLGYRSEDIIRALGRIKTED